jgi:ABC-type glutathione transport system ATPase component
MSGWESAHCLAGCTGVAGSSCDRLSDLRGAQAMDYSWQWYRNIAEHACKYPPQLSDGQLPRVAIARASA